MAVIGQDDRMFLRTDAVGFPFSTFVYVEARFPDGVVARGSASFVGTNDLLTAAHVIYSHDNGGYATDVRLVPNANYNFNTGQNIEPYGSYLVGQGNLAVTNAWEATNPNISPTPWAFDYGIISVEQSLGTNLGWLNIGVTNERVGEPVLSVGYPSDIPSRASTGHPMILTAGTVDIVQDGSARFTDDLDSFPGQSGSPVFQDFDNNEVIGVISNERYFPASNGIVTFDAFRERILNKFIEANGDGSELDVQKTPMERFLEPYVDDGFYYSSNQDVYLAQAEADMHFSRFGWREGRDPSNLFDTSEYLQQNPDIAAANVNPLEHWVAFGWREGRTPGFDFDSNRYLRENPDVANAGINPMLHYMEFGFFEGRAAFDVFGWPTTV